MFIYRQKQKGMVLICAVAILAVLSIMATSFVRMMTLNLQAAKNHLNYVDAKFTAIAGIEAAKAKMWQYMLSNKWDAQTGNPNAVVLHDVTATDPDKRTDLFWYPSFNTSSNKPYRDLETACKYKKIKYSNNVPKNEIGISLTQADNDSPFYYSGVVGRKYSSTKKFGRYEYNGNTYALKIQDNQGKLNLNSHRPYSTTSNSYNATYAQYGNIVMNKIIQCLAEQCEFNTTVATNLANALRDPTSRQLPNFSSMSEVEGIVDSIIPDPDPEDPSYDAIISQKLNFLDNVCITSMLDSNCYALANPKSDSNLRSAQYINDWNTKYYREYRSPININTASVELIAALIQSIQSQTRVYMPTPATSSDTFNDSLAVETGYSYNIYTYPVSFSKSQAKYIAQYLLNPKGEGAEIPRHFYHSMTELESYIQFLATPTSRDSNTWQLYQNVCSIRTNCFNPTSSYTIKNYTSFCNNMWCNIWADTLKANFNPNVRENFFNPDFIYRQYVQKSDLHIGETPTYSTELCFETYGHIDIQSIGKITANNKNLVVASSVMQESVGFSSITSLTTYNDFRTDGVTSQNIFPYNEQQDCIANRKESVGYIQASFMQNSISSCPALCHTVYDGIMMQEIHCNNAIKDTPGYDGFTQFNLSNSPVTPADIYKSSGSLSFWFKPTEDGHSPLFCSLFSASYVNTTNKQYVPYPVQYTSDGYSSKSTYHDGIQMFAYKNTNQQVVVSRIFFCGYFNDSGEYVNGIKSLAVDVDSGYLPGQATYMVNGKSQTGIKRKYARIDYIIPLSGHWWCENEWNCLYISWNDATGNLTASLTFDSGTTISGSPIVSSKAENTTSSPKFCIINEKNPSNRIQINGVGRNQKKGGGTPDGRLFIIDEALHLPGNSTINNLKSGVSTTARTIPDYTDTIYIPLNVKTSTNDPNKNPFLNSNLKPETTWGIIGALSWISYPETSTTSDKYFIRTSIVNYINVACQLTTDIHTSKMSFTNEENSSSYSIPYSYPSSRRIVRNTGNTNLTCSITMTNAPVHPTILDSISLQILYPYTVSSSILQ